MKQINTKEFANSFAAMIEELMHKFKYVGEWNWGDPAGQIDDLPTYEITAKEGTIWCTIIEWGNATTLEPNRKGIVATFPVRSKQSLGHIMATNIPYEFKRTYTTRAYSDGDRVEIRNYGKVTVGRAGIKKLDFFNYMSIHHPELVFIDEENQKYIKAFEYERKLSKDEFASQSAKLTLLMDEFKKQYRK